MYAKDLNNYKYGVIKFCLECFLFILENTKFLLYPCGEIYKNIILQRAFQISEVPPACAIYHR